MPVKGERMNGERRRLTTGTAVGYSIAGIADAGLYNFVFMFFLYFLTNVAGVQPAFAGTIVLVSTLCDIFITPIVSQISDNSRSRFGRRRIFILVAAVPMFIAALLMFSVFDMSEAAKNIYYIVVTIVFWITFGLFVVPYYALAPELTDVQEERTKLRIPFLIFNSLGNLLGMSAPMTIVGFFITKGYSDAGAWLLLVVIIGGVSSLSLIITYFTTKGNEIPVEVLPSKKENDNILVVYGRLLKLKPTKYLMLITAIYMVVYGMVISSLTYFVIYNLGRSESDVSIASLLLVLALIVLSPVVCSLAVKFERNKVLAFSMFFAAVSSFLFRLAGIDSIPVICVYLVLFGVANAGYWGLVQAMFYDLAEIYEYKYGKRVEGAAVGLNIVVLKVFTALAAQILGIFLELGNYDAGLEIQPQSALNMIYNTFTVIPAALLILAGIFALLNPVNKKNYPLLLKALDSKRKGEEHSTEGLEKVL